MMMMRTTKAGEEKLDTHPSLYQQYLAKLKEEARRLRTENQLVISPTHEFTSTMGLTMRAYSAADGERIAKTILSKNGPEKLPASWV